MTRNQIRSYRDLEAWQEAMDLADMGYDLIAQFPRSEQYRLVDQLQRALVSVPSQIAEGHPQTTRAFYNKLRIAQGELAEAKTQMEFAMRRGYIRAAECERFLDAANQVGKKISALMGAMRRRMQERGAAAGDDLDEDEG